jgi:hypothetical protein
MQNTLTRVNRKSANLRHSPPSNTGKRRRSLSSLGDDHRVEKELKADTPLLTVLGCRKGDNALGCSEGFEGLEVDLGTAERFV